MNTFYLDMDEVLVNSYDSLCRMKQIQNPYEDPNNLGQYNISNLVGIRHYDFWHTVTHEEWASMDKTLSCDSLINLAQELEETGLYKWRFLTSPITEGACFSGKFEWIKRNFPQYLHKLVIGKHKQDIVKAKDFLIDDSPANLKYFTEAGKRDLMYFFPSVGNSNYAKLPKNEQEVANLIEEIKLLSILRLGD